MVLSRLKKVGGVFILAVAAIAVNIFFTALKIINVSHITYLYTFEPQTINITIISPLTDLLLWIATLTVASLIVLALGFRRKDIKSLLAISVVGITALLVFQVNPPIAESLGVLLSFLAAFFFIFYSSGFSVGRRFATCLIVVYLCCIILILEAASLLSWLSNLFNYSVPFESVTRWHFAQVDRELFNVIYPATSWLFLVFLSCWIWVPLLKCIHTKFILCKGKLIEYKSSLTKLSNRTLTAALIAIAAVAVLVAYYPSANLPDSTLSGTDSTYYYQWINNINLKGPAVALEMDRPFSVLLLYLTQTLTLSSTETVIKIFPIACCVLLSLAVFWFVNVGTKNKNLALLASLLTVFSFQTTVSLFVYSLSNWLALIEMFGIFGLFLLSTQRHFVKLTVATTLLGVIMLLTHPYTWEVTLAILSTYLIYAIVFRNRVEKAVIKQLIIFLTVNAVFFAVYSFLPFGQKLGVAGGAFMNYTPAFSIDHLLNVQTGLQNMMAVWVGGLLTNPLMVVLAVVGVFTITDYSIKYNRFLFLWVAVPAVALLAFAPTSFFYYRLVYLIPIQIFAATGLNLLLDKLESVCKIAPRKFLFVRVIIIAVVVALMFNYALRASDIIPLHVLSG